MEIMKLLKSEVFQEVHKITAYTGLKSGQLEHLASTGDDENIMATFWNEAVTSLLETVGKYGNVPESDGNDTVTIQMDVPQNWKRERFSDFRCLVRQYLINAICVAWFGLSFPEKSVTYQTANLNLAKSIRLCLAGRKKPNRN